MRHGTTTKLALLTLIVVPSGLLADEPPLPDSRLGTRTAPILLLSRADVRADLKLTDQQAASADRIVRELYLKASALKGKAGDEAVSARRVIDDESRRWLDSQLSAGQRARLGQIDLQWEGPAALATRASLAETLGLGDGQRRALTQAVARRKQAKGGPDADRVLAEEVLATLTDEQKAKWKAMLGPAFEVKPSR